MVAPATIEALGALDAATIYNVLKGLGRAEPGSYSGPELRCLFPDLGTLVGYAVTSEWTGGEPEAPNEDYLELLELIEAMPKPVVSVLVDVGSRPGRSGIAGDGMMREFQVLGADGRGRRRQHRRHRRDGASVVPGLREGCRAGLRRHADGGLRAAGGRRAAAGRDR